MNIYSSITTDFTNNGYGFLTCIDAKITEVINGEYSLSFSIPNNSLLSEYIIEENIVKCNGQLFRIKDISKGTSTIRVYATHIFYDLLDNIVEDIIPTNLTCESMIDYVLEHTNYETSFVGSSTIEGSTTARFVRRNPVEILIGDLDNSIAKLYNAEIERDNYTIKMKSRRGADNNVKLILGKNIKEIDIKVNTQNQITRVMPIGFDGLLLPEKYIDSPLITNTPKIRKIELNVKYDPNDELAYATLEDAYAEMRRQVQELFTLYRIDEPEISITVNWVELSKTEEYKNYSVLERVNLGDTITISMHGIQYTTRVIKTVYNALNDTIEQFEIGTFRSNLSYNTTKTIEELQEKIDLINQTSILENAQANATALITSAMGGYVYKTANELFIMDTDNPNTATKVWRWNVNGLGYSSNGAYGTYELAMTADGAIVADFITTGTMSADRIEGLSEIITDELNIIVRGEIENIELQRPFYRYSANADGSSMTTSPQASTRYLGTYVGTEASSTYTDYTWTLIKGADGQDGEDGLPGTPGADGITYYTWIRYSDNADGTGLYETPTANTLYIGIAYNKTSATPSSTKTDYVWSKFKGDTGTAGSDGEDGVTTYTWIKYADDVNGTNLSDNPTGKTYIGLAYNKTTATESTTPSDYTWALIKGADGSSIWTTTVAPTTPNYTFTISNLVGPEGMTPKVGDTILYSYYKYTVTTVGSTTLLAGTRVSIRGATGATGTGAKWYTGTAITGTSTTATVFSDSGITAAIVGDMYLNTSTNNTYRCTLAGNAATAKWVFEVNIKGLDGSDGDDGKSLWLAYCDEIETYTGFSTNPADSDKDYYGMYVGLAQSNTATDYEWYPSTYKLDGDIGELDDYVKTTVEGRIDTEAGRITAESRRIDNLEDFTEEVSTTGNYVKLTGTPVSNGAIKSLSIKGFVLSDLYPSLAYPSESTYPTRLSFYTLVFDSVSTFNSTPSYVYINSPIPLQKITTTYDEISIVGNKVSIIQRIGYSGTTPIVLGTPIVHDVGSVLLPTFDGDTYVKVLYGTNLIFSSTYMQKNALTNVFASQLESSAILSITNDAINSKVSKDGVISEINQSPEEISINASKISLQGYTTVNDGFSVDLEGNATMNNATINGPTLKLADNTEIVGGNGILTNLQYKSVGVTPLGYRQINFEGIGLLYGFIELQGFIPDNFTIREAYITVSVYKTLNEFLLPETFDTTSTYGKVTNIRLYKVASTAEYINSTDFGLFGFDLPTGTEVTNAFATGGYTNPTTGGITFTSVDIADELDGGTNDFFIATGDTLPDGGTNAGTTTAAQKSQIAIATLTIIGFAK